MKQAGEGLRKLRPEYLKSKVRMGVWVRVPQGSPLRTVKTPKAALSNGFAVSDASVAACLAHSPLLISRCGRSGGSEDKGCQKDQNEGCQNRAGQGPADQAVLCR